MLPLTCVICVEQSWSLESLHLQVNVFGWKRKKTNEKKGARKMKKRKIEGGKLHYTSSFNNSIRRSSVDESEDDVRQPNSKAGTAVADLREFGQRVTIVAEALVEWIKMILVYCHPAIAPNHFLDSNDEYLNLRKVGGKILTNDTVVEEKEVLIWMFFLDDDLGPNRLLVIRRCWVAWVWRAVVDIAEWTLSV